MNYFILRQSKIFTESVQVTDWKGKINPKWLCIDELYQTPKNSVLQAVIRGNLPFPDIITVPFLMVTDLVYKVIKMYGEEIYTREIILEGMEKQDYKRYYLAVIDNVSKRRIPLEERNIFYMEKDGHHDLIVSLDFAESILRRGAVGFDLEEIILPKDGGDNDGK